MTDGALFRVMFIIVFCAFAGPALFYRIRSRTNETLDRWQEGTFILVGLRLSGILCVGGVVAWLINPQWMAWSSLPIPVWLRWAGIGMLLLWGILVIWTFHYLGTNLTDTVVTRLCHTLVTTGPYRFVRHPFYLAFALALVGTTLIAANWFVLLTGCIPLGFLVARTRIEEAKLLERFGDDYRDYMARTGRFLPRPRR